MFLGFGIGLLIKSKGISIPPGFTVTLTAATNATGNITTSVQIT